MFRNKIKKYNEKKQEQKGLNCFGHWLRKNSKLKKGLQSSFLSCSSSSLLLLSCLTSCNNPRTLDTYRFSYENIVAAYEYMTGYQKAITPMR